MCLVFWKNKETYDQTYKYFVALSEKENEIGFWGLGEMYYYGQYVKKDIALAIKWYEKAANKGDFLSQQMLGNLYYDGDMTVQDFLRHLNIVVCPFIIKIVTMILVWEK